MFGFFLKERRKKMTEGVQFLMINSPYSFDDVCGLNEFCDKKTCFKCTNPQYYYYYNAFFLKNQKEEVKKENKYKRSFGGKTKYRHYYTIGTTIDSIKRVK